MRPLLYFALILTQFPSGLATNGIHMTCFLENNGVLNIFSTSDIPLIQYAVPDFENLKARSVVFNKDNWSFDANDLEYSGLKESIIDDIGFNFETNVFRIIFHTDMFTTYPYKTNGTLFSMPIEGEGIAKVSLANVQIGIIMPFDIVEKSDKKFLQLNSFSTWYEVRDNATFELSNLYYGDEKRCRTMHELMNQNWKYVISRYGQVFMDKLAEKVFHIFRNNMKKVPLKDSISC